MNEFDRQLLRAAIQQHAAIEAAFPLSAARTGMFAPSHTYAEHLMKMLVFGVAAQDYNKWANEVVSYCKIALGVKVRKGNKLLKRIPLQEAKECFFYARFDDDESLSAYYDSVVEDNSDYIPCISFENLAQGFWQRYERFISAIYPKAADKLLTKSSLVEQVELLRGDIK